MQLVMLSPHMLAAGGLCWNDAMIESNRECREQEAFVGDEIKRQTWPSGVEYSVTLNQRYEKTQKATIMAKAIAKTDAAN